MKELFDAIEQKASAEALRWLLAANPGAVAERNAEGVLPLHWAAKCNASADVISILLAAQEAPEQSESPPLEPVPSSPQGRRSPMRLVPPGGALNAKVQELSRQAEEEKAKTKAAEAAAAEAQAQLQRERDAHTAELEKAKAATAALQSSATELAELKLRVSLGGDASAAGPASASAERKEDEEEDKAEKQTEMEVEVAEPAAFFVPGAGAAEDEKVEEEEEVDVEEDEEDDPEDFHEFRCGAPTELSCSIWTVAGAFAWSRSGSTDEAKPPPPVPPAAAPVPVPVQSLRPSPRRRKVVGRGGEYYSTRSKFGLFSPPSRLGLSLQQQQREEAARGARGRRPFRAPVARLTKSGLPCQSEGKSVTAAACAFKS